MSFGKFVTLSNGALMPQIGLGTWMSKPNEVENAVSSSNFIMAQINSSSIRSRLQSGMDIVTSISL